MEATNTRETEIRFGDLWNVFKKCWIFALIAAILVGAGAFAAMKITHVDQYTATSTIWALGSNAHSSGKTTTNDVSIGTYLINDYKELILTDSVLEEALKRAESDMSLSALRSNTKVTNNDDTRVMYVSVTAGTPEEAKTIADEITEVFCTRINDKIDDEDSEQAKTLVSPWEQAKLPTRISNPVSIITAALIAIVAAIAVYVVFLVLHLLDDKISTTKDVEQYLGCTLLGVIPNREEARRRGRKKKLYYHYSGAKNAD